MSFTEEVNIIFGGKKIPMPAMAGKYDDGSKFYLTGTSGKLYVVTENRVSEINVETTSTDRKIINIFNKRVKEAKHLETQTFKWKFLNKILQLVDLTAGFRNLTTAIRPMLDFTGGPSIMRGIDGTMVMLYGAYKVHDAAGKIWGAWHKSHVDVAPFIDFLKDDHLFEKAAWKEMLIQCFESVEVRAITNAGLEAVYGISAMVVGFMMILLSAVLWSGKTVILPLAKVLMGMYIGSLIANLYILYTSIKHSYNLWKLHSDLKNDLVTGDLNRALLRLNEMIDPTNEVLEKNSADLLLHAEELLNDLISSGALKEKLQTTIRSLIKKPEERKEEIIELIQEVLDDNVKQRTLDVIKILLALWGITYMLVGIITTGGLANIAVNAVAWAVAFAVLSCLAWFSVDNEPLADMVGNAGVWLVQKYDELLIKRTLSIALFSGLVKAGAALHMNVDYLNRRLQEKEADMARLRGVQQRLHLLRSKQGKVHQSKSVVFDNGDTTREDLLNQTRRDLDGAWTLVVDGKTRFAPSMDSDRIDGILEDLEREFQGGLMGDKANTIAVQALTAVSQTNYVPPTQGLISQFGVSVSNAETAKFVAYIKTKGDVFDVTIKGALALYGTTSKTDKVPLAEAQSEVHIIIPKNGDQATMTWSYSISKINHLGFSILSYQHLNDASEDFTAPLDSAAEEYFVN